MGIIKYKVTEDAYCRQMDDEIIKALGIDKGQLRTFKIENILSSYRYKTN